jgi:hypothetical protein
VNILGIVLYIKKQSINPVPTIEINVNELKPVETIPPIIDQINGKNQKINSLICKKTTFYTTRSGMTVKLTGEVAYDKDLNFRMLIKSVFGLELDLGSNKEYFWYWSRRDKHPSLYFAKHEDFEKTRLKTPFDPIFIKSSLGIDVVDVTNAIFAETEKDLLVTCNKRNSIGDTIHQSIMMDKYSQRIKGYFLTDIQNKPIALVEIKKSSDIIPLEVLYVWFEEDCKLLVCLEHPLINTEISTDYWEIPNIQPKINMAEDSTY